MAAFHSATGSNGVDSPPSVT